MISLTKAAAEKISQSLYERRKGIGLRVGVRGSGCSGFAYLMEYADQLFEGDIEIDERGVTLIVNKQDLVYLQGLEIDYKKEQFKEGFEFSNPNERGRCGCGESFTV